jgi:hypothetical protein
MAVEHVERDLRLEIGPGATCLTKDPLRDIRPGAARRPGPRCRWKNFSGQVQLVALVLDVDGNQCIVFAGGVTQRLSSLSKRLALRQVLRCLAGQTTR